MSDLSVAGELTSAPPAPPAPAAPTPPAPPAEPGAPTPPAPPAAPTPPAPPAPPAPNSVALPGKDAKAEEWKAFFKAAGAPENADGYKLQIPEGHDPAFSKAAAGVFAEIGLMPQQAERLNAWWNEQAANAQKATTTAAEAAETAASQAAQAKAKQDDDALRNEFQGEKYTAMKESARKAVMAFFPGSKDEQTAALSALEGVMGYGGLYRFLNGIGAGLAEGKLRGIDGGGAPPPKPLANQMFDDVLAKAGFPPKS